MFKTGEIELPPHSLEAERAVLGSLLIDPEAIHTIKFLKPTHFYQGKNGLIFKAIQCLDSADLVTLTDHLEKNGVYDKVGGASYLSSLSMEVPTASAVKHYAKIVRDNAVRRDIIISSDRQKTIAMDVKIDNPLTKALEEFNNIDRYADDVKDPDYIVAEYLELLRTRRAFKGLTGVLSGLPGLDRITKGFQKGNLIVLAAGTSIGKSALALQIALNAVVKQKKQILFFTLEMTDLEVTDRLLAMHFGVPLHNIQRGVIKTKQEVATRDKNDYNIKRLSEVKSLPLFVVDDSSITVDDVERYAYSYQNKYGIDMIVFDYLQIAGDKSNEGEVKRITEISRKLKKLASELKIPVLVLSQFSRDYEKQGRVPSLKDLKWSGSIEQDANVGIVLHRRKVEEGNPDAKELSDIGDLWVEKNRQGRRGEIEVKFMPDTVNFVEIDTEHTIN